MSYARLSRKPLLFRSFTGLEIAEFDIISKEIESKYYEHERKRLSNRKRKRDVGVQADHLSESQRKIRYAASLLQVIHHIYIIRISI